MKHKSLNINTQLDLIVSELTQFIKDNKVNVSEMAQIIGYPRKRVSEVLAGKRHDLDVINNLSSYLLNKKVCIYIF